MTSDVEIQPGTGPSGPSPAPVPPVTSGSPVPSTWATLRSLLLRLHFYAGILVAPFLLVAATTGLLYAASFQLEKVVHSHELTVPVPAGQQKLPLARQVAAATAAHPGGTIGAVWTYDEPDATTRVLFDDPGLAESIRTAVFVDPYTAQVRGSLESYGSSGALPVRTWISQLHRHLHLGEPGRVYSEMAASWLWLVALGGLVLWLTRRRRAGRRLRRLVTPERGARGRRKTLSWHGSVGLWALVGLLALSATGLTWSKYAGVNVDVIQRAIGWGTPSMPVSGGHGDHGGHAGGDAGAAPAADVDQVVRAAAGKGLSGPLEIVWPAETGDPYVVKETDRLWPQRNDQVAVDAAGGQAVAELRFDDFPIGAKLTRWGIDGHMGVLFGLVNQILLAALAVALISVIVWGYRMWWLRRPTRGFGVPYERGGLRRLPLAVVLPLAAVAVAVGVFLPLLGISLLAFLVVDVVLARVAASRAEKPETGGPGEHGKSDENGKSDEPGEAGEPDEPGEPSRSGAGVSG
ncbi:PepSY-associated TM helix domain-containing protein [Streptosporangium sp. NPDC023825]|uniref:PepSY-associated TM helix domain-containing protein n=1 Tax=Streptosporangium sp. NPDC023825 TaxID=3154909 RepID=UPI003419A9BD